MQDTETEAGAPDLKERLRKFFESSGGQLFVGFFVVGMGLDIIKGGAAKLATEHDELEVRVHSLEVLLEANEVVAGADPDGQLERELEGAERELEDPEGQLPESDASSDAPESVKEPGTET